MRASIGSVGSVGSVAGCDASAAPSVVAGASGTIVGTGAGATVAVEQAAAKIKTSESSVTMR